MTAHGTVPAGRDPEGTMTRTRRTVVTVLAATLATVLLVPPAAAGSPAPTTCTEEAAPSGTTVRGDLHVAPGCQVRHVWVRGDVHVDPRPADWEGPAEAILWDVRVDGDVHVGRDMTFSARSSRVDGSVHLDDAFRASVDGIVGGDVEGGTVRGGLSGQVAGSVDVQLPVRAVDDPDPGFSLRRAEVGGSVAVTGGTVLVANSWLHAGLAVTDAYGVLVAESRVDADVVVQDSRGAVHLGDLHEVFVEGPPDWLDDGQQEQSAYGGDLLVRRNAGAITVGHVDVAGDLACADNAVAPTVQGSAVVAGARTGQCAPAGGTPPPAPPTPAPVPDPYVCAGEPTPPTIVPGDLVVTGDCDVRGVRVLGDVHVRTTAFLSFGGRVAGDVHLGPGARVQALATTVGGGVHLDRVASLELTGTVGRSVRGTAAQVRLGQLDVAGAVNVAAPEGVAGTGLLISQTRAGGWVNVHGGTTHVANSELSRGLTSSWARAAHVCGTSVLADVTVQDAQGAVRVGGRPTADGCAGDGTPVGNAFAAGLLLDDNRSRPVVRSTAVGGDLACRLNAGRPTVGPDVTVGGARTGQCA